MGCAVVLQAPAYGSCVCLNYLPSQPRPIWVQGDQVTDKHYIASGLTRCTGLQDIDFQDAEISARASLARLISAQVVSSVNYQESMHNSVSRSSMNTDTQINSSALLNEAVIFERWVDANTCTLYAGILLSKTNFQKSIKNKETQEKALLANQTISFAGHNQADDRVMNELASRLSKGEIRGITTKDQARLKVSVNVSDVQHTGKSCHLNLHLSLVDQSSGKTIWSTHASGKGASHTGKSYNILFDRAISDAFDATTPALIKYLKNASL